MVNSLRALLIIAVSAVMFTGCGYKEERIVVQEKALDWLISGAYLRDRDRGLVEGLSCVWALCPLR